MRGVASAFLVLLLLLLPCVHAAIPEPMGVSGRASVNGRAVPTGTTLSVFVAGSGPWATSRVGADGAFSFSVPGDDPETTGREGAAAGERLSFRGLGGESLPVDVAFAAGARRSVELAFLLPDLVVLGAKAVPEEVAEGRETRVQASVANRGNVTAFGVRVSVGEAGRGLVNTVLPDLAPGATAPVDLAVPTDGLAGNRTLVVQATATNGDAEALDSSAPVPVRVVGDPGPSVVVAHEPLAPLAGAPVTLVANASDPDGIASVRFHWESAGAGVRTLEVLAPPYRVVLGAFPANATVRYWAVATDAGPLNRTATTPTQVFEVRAGVPVDGTTPATTSPTVSTPATPPAGDGGGVPAPGVGLVAAALLVAALAAQARRRRT